jgi:hypothetical protein
VTVPQFGAAMTTRSASSGSPKASDMVVSIASSVGALPIEPRMYATLMPLTLYLRKKARTRGSS